MRVSRFTLAPFLASLAVAQDFIPTPQGLTRVASELFSGAEISFKRTTVCETTEGVNAYSGYVKLPKALLPDAAGWQDDWSANIFFWYFEARNDPENAPTSLYLGGGPGSSSFDNGADFPCLVNYDGNSTVLNEFSWNNRVNMLYIDQPVQTGFSYVTLQNSTYNFVTGETIPIEDPDDLPPLNVTVRQATLDSHEPSTLPNNTMSSARTIWAFSQVWFNEFPHWQTESDEISLWTTSYGGFYGPALFEHIQEQNELIDNGRPGMANATTLNLVTLGLSDSCIDVRSMAQGYAMFSFNNTYGLEIYPEEVFEMIMQNITDTETGCYGLIDNCRALAEQGDPQSFGTNQTVNEACVAATNLCYGEIQGAYLAFSDRGAFDVTVSNLTTLPLPLKDAFFNQRWVQEDLGVPLNFTVSSVDIPNAFFGLTGDPMRRTLHSLEAVLDAGVNVALMYGDRDYRCNWYGGENVSLSLEFDSSDAFRNAGYEPIITNSSYEGGLVREHGQLSFSRIFQAGHGVATFQPETMSRVFDRVMFGRDIATGEVDLSETTDYTTQGPTTVYDVLSEVPDLQENICYLYHAPVTCTEEQLLALMNGTAVMDDWVVVEPRGALPVALESKNPQEPGAGGGNDTVTEPSEPSAGSHLGVGLTGIITAMAVAVALF